MIRNRAWVALCCLLSSAFAIAAAAAEVNPAGIAYSSTLTNVHLYGKPTGLLVAGRCNRYNEVFAQARAKGAEVLAYIDPVERPDQPVCALDEKFYMGDSGDVPLWPFPSYGQRINWPNTHMTDMRPGSKWILHVVAYVEGLMREGKVDGVFLDVVGARPWGRLVDWDSWPQAEKDLWTDGNIDLVRRLHASRQRINPKFILINNNVWDRGDTRGLEGEKYVDGVVIEHPKLGVPAWHRKYVSKPFADEGQRRVLIIARNAADARLWAKVPGVTHVTDQMKYSYPNVPVIPFTPLFDRREK